MKDSASDMNNIPLRLRWFADRVSLATRSCPRTIALGLMSALLSLLSSPSRVCAQVDLPHPLSTWSMSPADGDWDTATNWVPARVPNDIADLAVFDTSPSPT